MVETRHYQARLAEVWSQTVAALIFDEGMQSGQRIGSDLLATIDDPSELAELGRLLTVDGEAGHCMCYGDATFELHGRDGSILALLGLHHGVSLRWETWDDDASLVDGRALLEWLAAKGVGGPYESWLEDERDRQEYLAQYNSWLVAIPPVLGGLKEQMDDLKRSGAGLSQEMIEESRGHVVLVALAWLVSRCPRRGPPRRSALPAK